MEYRNATLKEREVFYREEFDAEKMLASLRFSPQIYSVDPGTKTNITKFPGKNSGLIMLPPDIPLKRLKELLIHYLPESVYYDRNAYTNVKDFFARKIFKEFWKDKNYETQMLGFDIDAGNIRKVHHGNKDDYTALIKEAAQETIKVAKILREKHGFNDLTFVYSGRGFHLRVHDKGSEKLKFSERNAINDTLKGLPIDRWVSGGFSKLMRLPFSLHGVVSRVCTPIKEDELHSIDTENRKFLPTFLCP